MRIIGLISLTGLLSTFSFGQITGETPDEFADEVFEFVQELQDMKLDKFESHFMNLTDFAELAADTSLTEKVRNAWGTITQEQYHNRYERVWDAIGTDIYDYKLITSQLEFQNYTYDEKDEDGLQGLDATLYVTYKEKAFTLRYLAMLRNGQYELMYLDRFRITAQEQTDAVEMEPEGIKEVPMERMEEVPVVPPPVEIVEIDKPRVAVEIIDFPDVEAEFPGGLVSMRQFISETVIYPEVSLEMNEQGKVYLSFIVEKDGSITGIQVERGVSRDLDREAKRVIRQMPKWQPGEAHGKPVRTRVRLPIAFVIDNPVKGKKED